MNPPIWYWMLVGAGIICIILLAGYIKADIDSIENHPREGRHTMNKSVLVHGPQGCGKTRNADALAKHFGLDTIVDEGQINRPIDKTYSFESTNVLYLTSEEPSRQVRRQIACVPYKIAAQWAKLPQNPTTGTTP